MRTARAGGGPAHLLKTTPFDEWNIPSLPSWPPYTTMTISNLTNGHSVPERRPIAPGVFAPLPTFFLPDSQDLGESQ